MTKLLFFKGVAVLVLAIFLMGPKNVQAHPGNTATDDCHYCWTNCAYWGYVYGTRHCHPSYTTPTYVPYVPPVQSWSCTISGVKYTSVSSATAKWRELVHAAVDDVYKKLLERSSNQNDYNYWESKIPYNNCNFSVNSTTIWNEAKDSDERKTSLDKKYKMSIQILTTIPKNQTGTTTPSTNFQKVGDYLHKVWDSYTVEEGIIIFTLIGLGVFGLIMIISSIISNRKNRDLLKKPNLFCTVCGHKLNENAKFCTNCGKAVDKINKP